MKNGAALGLHQPLYPRAVGTDEVEQIHALREFDQVEIQHSRSKRWPRGETLALAVVQDQRTWPFTLRKRDLYTIQNRIRKA